jgi:hypothetical protein
VCPQPGTLPLPDVSGVGVVDPDDDPEVVPPLPSGEPVGPGWSGGLVESDGGGVVEVGGGAGGGGSGDGAGGVLVGCGLVVWFEDDPVLEGVEATSAVVGCVRAGVSLVPVVDRVVPLPPPASPPLREDVDALTLFAASLGARRVTCPTGRVPGLSGRTAETACPSSEPESAGMGSGANPMRLAQRAATHPASATPRATFPTLTAR